LVLNILRVTLHVTFTAVCELRNCDVGQISVNDVSAPGTPPDGISVNLQWV